MPRKISKSDREAQLSALALADGYEFVGWVGEYVGTQSRAIFNCPDHGEWKACLNDFANSGSRCTGCKAARLNAFHRIPQVECEKKVRDTAISKGYEFLGWVDGYKKNTSKVVIRCSTHGEWHVSVNKFVDKGTGCAACKGLYRYSKDERIVQLTELAIRDGYEFSGFVGQYESNRSKALFNCATHGQWECSVVSFANTGRRCPSCAVHGYRPHKPGTLYALMSDCGSMIKIGISNKPKKRHAELRNDTPFNFTIHREIHCVDGSIPPSLEKLFHSQFPSAGLKGFDGATEWRQMNPDITTWLELLA